jgi:hypothetical protein
VAEHHQGAFLFSLAIQDLLSRGARVMMWYSCLDGAPMSSHRKLRMISALLLMPLALAACQTHEFAKTGISTEQRDADSKKCFAEAREVQNGTRPAVAGGTPDAQIVAAPINGYMSGKAMGQYHRECMTKLGYERVPLN